MANYAMVEGNYVSNIIVADDKEGIEKAFRCKLVEISAENPAAPGWTYDENTGRFNEPKEETAVVL